MAEIFSPAQILLTVQTATTSLRFFFLTFFYLLLFLNLETNVLRLFFFSVLYSDLDVSWCGLDNSFLLSLFGFFSFLLCLLLAFSFLSFLSFSVFFSALYFVLPSVISYSSFCSLFCSLILCSFTYLLISLVVLFLLKKSSESVL